MIFEVLCSKRRVTFLIVLFISMLSLWGCTHSGNEGDFEKEEDLAVEKTEEELREEALQDFLTFARVPSGKEIVNSGFTVEEVAPYVEGAFYKEFKEPYVIEDEFYKVELNSILSYPRYIHWAGNYFHLFETPSVKVNYTLTQKSDIYNSVLKFDFCMVDLEGDGIFTSKRLNTWGDHWGYRVTDENGNAVEDEGAQGIYHVDMVYLPEKVKSAKGTPQLIGDHILTFNLAETRYRNGKDIEYIFQCTIDPRTKEIDIIPQMIETSSQ